MIQRQTKDLHEGERLRNAAHATLEGRRHAFVRRGQRALLTTLLERDAATADDVRAAVELPPGIDPKCLGAVPGALVRAGIIIRDGYMPTARAAAHARPVSVWRLKDRAAAEQWLVDHPEIPEPPPARDKAQRLLPLGESGEPTQ